MGGASCGLLGSETNGWMEGARGRGRRKGEIEEGTTREGGVGERELVLTICACHVTFHCSSVRVKGWRRLF